ncbi:MAG: deoxyribodipyrimidine photo-lyase [Taibaiella sp.]|nr:deoxyribodipyrimidine photo-lyase [Taibaiella sp.]
MTSVTVFWYRRDLRLHDNAGLYYALKTGRNVLPLFILDKNILDDLKDKKDRRVDFILRVLAQMQEQFAQHGSGLKVMYGTPDECFNILAETYTINAVYTNHDYEPYAALRDNDIRARLKAKNIELHTYKDQVIFEKGEVIKDNGEPYTVYTPYSKKWRERLNSFYLKPYSTEKYFNNLLQYTPEPLPTLKEIGFEPTDLTIPPAELNEITARKYNDTRNYPAIAGTTRQSLHLRFGTVSIRELAKKAQELNDTLLNELIWREFYMMILWHFPNVVNQAFKKDYDNIRWRNNEKEFVLWCEGKTGVPIVDAGMRELNTTGFMHNRVRMITASFLTKNLLIDWRWGEAYFARQLLDYDLSANNGGWQWVAGSGCDSAPYFRIFSPQLQTEKFDPELRYIRHWVPEYDQLTYPQPIVDIKASRARCLEEYKRALNRS